ncbi:MAG TPA: hypothetical protein VGH99_12615 [Pseudonocardia sp.]|jgi:hypothetical protein
MDPTRVEDLLYGGVLAVVTVIALIVVVAELARGARRDREIISATGGFAALIGVCAIVLCTGLVDLLPLPK